jgi:hypothetical protein
MALQRKMIRVAVREVDRGLKPVMKSLETIRKKDSYVQVGVLAEGKGLDDRGEGMNNAEIAALHEFGSEDGKIPERSFLRSTLNENRAKYVLMLKALLKRLYSQEITVERVLGIMGAQLAADVKKKITAGEIKPPNAPATVARKLGLKKDGGGRLRGGDGRFTKGDGTTRPLVDTGQMVRAITWRVVIQRKSLLRALRG